MKLLLLAENWPPRRGGIENYLTHIVSFLPKESVTVVVPQGNAPEEIPIGAGIQAVIRKRFFWPIIKPSWLPLFFFIKGLLKKNNVDIIFCGKTLFEGLLAYHIKKSLNTPYVVFTYAMEIEVWAKTQSKKLQRVLQLADRVVYINEETKKTLLELGVSEKQLVKIWPGVSEFWFEDISAEKQTATLNAYGITKPYVLTGARLIARKGIDIVIEAFAGLDTATRSAHQLVIFGEGPEEKHLKELAAKQPGIEITFLGHVPTHDLPALYKNAAVFVLPPRVVKEDREGFGIVYLEAGAAGIPVIGTLTGGVPEAVIHNQTGILVQPDNSKAVQEAMETILTNPSRGKELGLAGKTRAWDEFRWSKRILLVKGMIDAIQAEQILLKTRRG